MGHVRVCGGSGWVTARFYPANSVFQHNRGKSQKNACRVCLRYLRYATAGNSKGFLGISPGPADTGVKSSLCCREEICEGQRTVSQENTVTLIRLPDARVIYWETDGGVPDKETIVFEFPGGIRQCLEVPSFKFPRYSPAELEEMGLGILLPFCLLRLRRELKGVEKGGGVPRRLGERVAELLKEAKAAAERSEGRGIISQGDLVTVLRLIERLRDELYEGYTEEGKEPEMWENIELINYNEIFDGIEKKAAEQVAREKEQAARKLRELGVSDEVLAAAGLAIPRQEF
jgi:hypothetical protein